MRRMARARIYFFSGRSRALWSACLTQQLPCRGPAELAQWVVVRQAVTERFPRARRQDLGWYVSEQRSYLAIGICWPRLLQQQPIVQPDTHRAIRVQPLTDVLVCRGR